MTDIVQPLGSASSQFYFTNPIQLCSYETEPTQSNQPAITLLFIHGMESSKETWRPVIDKLQETYRIIAIDLRGHGETPLGSGEFSTLQLVADIEQFVQEKKLHQFVIIGHSLGARIAIPYAAKHPEQIQALVIEDMEVLERAKENISSLEIEHLRQFNPVHPDLESIKKELRAYGYSSEKIESWIQQGRIKQMDDGKTYFSAINPYISYLLRKACSSSDTSLNAFKELHKHDLPVLLLKAEIESSISTEGLEQMKELLPSLHVEVVKSSFHSIHKTAKEEFLRLLNLFLEQHAKNFSSF